MKPKSQNIRSGTPRAVRALVAEELDLIREIEDYIVGNEEASQCAKRGLQVIGGILCEEIKGLDGGEARKSCERILGN